MTNEPAPRLPLMNRICSDTIANSVCACVNEEHNEIINKHADFHERACELHEPMLFALRDEGAIDIRHMLAIKVIADLHVSYKANLHDFIKECFNKETLVTKMASIAWEHAECTHDEDMPSDNQFYALQCNQDKNNDNDNDNNNDDDANDSGEDKSQLARAQQ